MEIHSDSEDVTSSTSENKFSVIQPNTKGNTAMKLLEAYQMYCLAADNKNSLSTDEEKEAVVEAHKKHTHNNSSEEDGNMTFEQILQYCQNLSEKTLPTVVNVPDTKNAAVRRKGSPLQNNEVESTTTPSSQSPPCENGSTKKQTDGSQSPDESGKVTMVKSGSHTYTKITMVRKDIQASPTSAFTPRHKLDDACDARATKRLREDPHLKHLKISGNGGKAPLIRSSSMPVSSFNDDDDTASMGSPRNLQHRAIYRTGSVSDATKQKLKNVILLKKSAALVRKPSITEQEIRHITNDVDSSQSDEDDDGDDESRDVKFGSTEPEHQTLSLATNAEVPLVLTMTTT